jgi:hypothetical protein
MSENEERQETGQDLLPGWSSLVVMLMIFGALALITMLNLLRGGDDHVDQTTHGRVAYSPEDFPEIEFDVQLQPAVLEAPRGVKGSAEVFNVPPPPFSDEDLFPCTECHADMEVNYEQREMEDMHEEIRLNHGPKERWCLDCHNADNRDKLRLVNGTLVGFEESYKLCGQCHGTIYRDWRAGIHGRRRGFWNGPQEYLLCAHCHNPHAPKFQAMTPLPPPIRPQFLGKALRGSSDAMVDTEGAHQAEEGHSE